MAAKAPVSKTPFKATAAKAAPKGLQLTTAQQAAYNKAYTAAATKARTTLALQSSATGFRKYRLQAAYATVKTYNAAHHSAQTAAIAAYAARRSYVQSHLAHQNSALQARIELDMYNHANLAGRLQYISAGEKAYAHSAVMRTVDQKQALTYEAGVFKAVAKTAVKASKSTVYKAGPNSAAIAKTATAAGLKAAKKIPKSAVARTCAMPLPPAGAPAYCGSPAYAAAAYAAAMYTAHTRAMTTPQGLEKDWLGDEVTPNCVITAIANHLLFVKGVRASEHELKELFEACSPEPAIEEVLWTAWSIGWAGSHGVHLGDYHLVEPEFMEDSLLVIGFATPYGDHAGLSMDDAMVVSWGKVQDRESPVEEAWELIWET